MDEIHYRLPFRIRGQHPGFHRSDTVGGGLEFHDYESLLRARDPRRVDIRASLRNPYGELLVRGYRQRSSIAVSVVADLSASMGAPGRRGKMDQLSKFVRMLGFSATRTGDRFGFVGCDDKVRKDLLYPPSRWPLYGAIADRLDRLVPRGRGAEGLAAAGNFLGTSRGLVFLVSDYLFPEALLEAAITGLDRHVLVPVVLAHATDVDAPSSSGLVRAVDSETGRSRFVWLRRAMRVRLREAYRAHRQGIARICGRHGLQPLLLADPFSADDVSRYFFPLDGRR